jgi:hypothetical protein
MHMRDLMCMPVTYAEVVLVLALLLGLLLRQWLSALNLLLLTCTRRHQALASVLLGALLSRETRPIAQSSQSSCTAIIQNQTMYIDTERTNISTCATQQESAIC